jgi:DNA-binding transcriptional regulator GbsR (MarR family)
MKKIPVNVRVSRAIASMMPNGANVKDIAKITGMANQNVSACLWKLKNEGKISKENMLYKINDFKLTPVNKEVEEQMQSLAVVPTLEANDESNTLTLGKVARKLSQENERLKKEIGSVEQAWRDARQAALDFERKYFDALAVISYLEAK